MNQSLLDPFQRFELPQQIEEVLREGKGHAKSLAFNRRGTLLAVGWEDGSLLIYDFETRGLARTYKPHSARITTLAWSANGRFLASGSTDKSVVLTNVELGTQEARVLRSGAITRISLNQHDHYCCLASYASGPAELISLRDQACKALPYITVEGEGKHAKASTGGTVLAEALFDRSGSLIFVSQSRGTIAVLDASTLQHIDTIKVTGHNRITSMALNSKGTALLANCSDRHVRLYHINSAADAQRLTGDQLRSHVASNKAPAEGSLLGLQPPILQLQRSFDDKVDRRTWRAAAFTGNGEHVGAASLTAHEHMIFIWDIWGKLEAVLRGPNESIVDMAWHPTKAILATISSTGLIYLWARIYRENWAAFAPDFEELHDNFEYEEREDEFDIQNPALEMVQVTNRAEDEEDVDIEGLDEGLSSDGEGDDSTCLHHLQVDIRPPTPPPADKLGSGEAEGASTAAQAQAQAQAQAAALVEDDDAVLSSDGEGSPPPGPSSQATPAPPLPLHGAPGLTALKATTPGPSDDPGFADPAGMPSKRLKR
ncbi:hypothetical protein WJX73_000407 [Symbiochloris irregularis]|uniref:Anaphase-promoting complex subunit 4-like WD40 domain-containing protein n=1 Tax=Symbiochloris irregularis TaxID=706552 RepID=A0AAW1NY01_9CHLO